MCIMGIDIRVYKLFFFTIGCFLTLKGQVTGSLQKENFFSDKIAPSIVSPAVANFANKISYPDISNNGLLNISVPIYSVEDRDLKIPISIFYNTRNLKVNSNASFVGTGWSLDQGGIITRIVKDIPDDANFTIHPPIYGSGSNGGASFIQGWLNNDLRAGSRVEDFPNSDRYSSSFDSNSPLHVGNILGYYVYWDLKVRDLEPDVYHFSAGGESFSFIFNEDGVPKILGLKDYKIEYNKKNLGIFTYNVSFPGKPVVYDGITAILTEIRDIITDFIITSPQGYKYYFNYNDTEKNQVWSKKYKWTVVDTPNYGSLTNQIVNNVIHEYKEFNPKQITTWHLSKIVSPTGQEAKFTYTDELIVEKPKIPIYKGHCLTPNCTDEDRSAFNILDDTDFDRRSQYDLYTKKINEINTENIKVIFSSGELRKDSKGGRVLSKIDVYSKIELRKPNKAKFTFTFDYSYTTSPDCNDALEPEWCKRLFLNKIEQIKDNEKITRYEFNYNDQVLPSRFSDQQDFWGYYNANKERSLIPKLYVYPNKVGLERYRVYPNSKESLEYVLPGADRSVNSIAILAGSLKRIKFSTGGYRDYIFEPNKYYDYIADKEFLSGGLRLKKVLHSDGESNVVLTKEYSYDKEIEGKIVSSGILYANPVYGSETNYFKDPDWSYNSSTGKKWGDFVFYSFKTRNYTPQSVKNNYFSPDKDSYGDQNYVSNDFDRWDKYTKRSSIAFNQIEDSQGNSVLYTIITERINGNGKIVHEYYEPITYDLHQTEINKGFGKFSTYGNIVLKPYGLSDYNNSVSLSSDVLQYINSSYNCYFDDGDNSNDGGLALELMYPGNMQVGEIGPASISGTHLGFSLQPYPPMSRTEANLDYYRGKKKSETYFSTLGKKIKQTLFEYKVFRDDDELVYGLVYKNYDALCAKTTRQGWFSWAKYHYITNAEAQINKVINREFSQNDEKNFVETIENFYYDHHPNNSLLTRKSLIESRGSVITTKIYYPYGAESLTFPYRNELLDQHRLSEPLKQEVKKDGQLLAVKQNEQGSFSGGMILHKKLLTAKSNNTLEEETVIDFRDEYGNIIQYTTKDGVPHVILWDYNKVYPVMTIDNVTYSQVVNSYQKNYSETLAEEIAHESESTMLRWQLNLRKCLEKDQINTKIISYTYDPLIGVTSITDVKGYTTYYEYDSFSRLRLIKDHNGNILIENRYAYKN